MEPRNYLANADAAPPAVPGAPSNGYPRSATPGVEEATTPGPYWFYKMGESLRRIIVAAGLTPDDADLDLLKSAIMKAPKMTVLTASDAAWVPDSAAVGIKFTAVGAGGGGGGVDGQGAGTSAASRAGAAGGASIKSTNIIEASYAITIGAGGTGGAAGSNNGANGGSTIIASTSVNLTCTGGNGGNGHIAISGSTWLTVPNSGSGSGGDINIDGDSSGDAAISSGERASASSSGGSVFGGSVKPSGSATPGANAVTPGAGGGSTTVSDVGTNTAGGDGADGVVIIEEFF